MTCTSTCPTPPPSVLVDVQIRLDACDSLRGGLAAYACLSDPGAESEGRGPVAPCASMAAPVAGGDGANNGAVSTRGSDVVLYFKEPSNNHYVSVAGVPFSAFPNVTGASEAAFVKYGSVNSYELTIFDGAPVIISNEPLEAFPITVAKLTATSARVSWTPPVARRFSYLNDSPNVTALGVHYKVYYSTNHYISSHLAQNDTRANLAFCVHHAQRPGEVGLPGWLHAPRHQRQQH
jgi:hypothetical protein